MLISEQEIHQRTVSVHLDSEYAESSTYPMQSIRWSTLILALSALIAILGDFCSRCCNGNLIQEAVMYVILFVVGSGLILTLWFPLGVYSGNYCIF